MIETVINIGLNHAVVLIGENSQKLGKVLGKHPMDNVEVLAKSGRFGPYVEHGKNRATLNNIIPASTGAAKAVGKVLPHLNGKINRTELFTYSVYEQPCVLLISDPNI